jgi:hypothetical protein
MSGCSSDGCITTRDAGQDRKYVLARVSVSALLFSNSPEHILETSYILVSSICCKTLNGGDSGEREKGR